MTHNTDLSSSSSKQVKTVIPTKTISSPKTTTSKSTSNTSITPSTLSSINKNHVIIPSHIIDDDDEDPFESESDTEMEDEQLQPQSQPTINPKQSLCWSCDVRLYDDIRSSNSGGNMTFQIHEHPVLQ